MGEILLPHLDAAHNLARWLMRDASTAQDVVQNAMLRAIEAHGSYRGGDLKAWLLRIVRNIAYDTLRATRRRGEDLLEDEIADPTPDAEATTMHREALGHAEDILARLPVEWREALVLRELEGLSYREIAAVTEAPIGTVMSRLSRARQALLYARSAQA